MMAAIANWRFHGAVALCARWYLGAVFIYASLHKIADPNTFALDVATYDILPLALVNLMALILPWVELVAGVLVIVAWRSRGAMLLIFGMMLMFLVAVFIALAKDLDASCGCFASQSAAQDPLGVHTVLRDLAWLLLAAYVLAFDRRPLGVDGYLARRKEAPPP